MKQMKYVLLVVMVLTLAVMSGCSRKNEKGADNGSAAAVTAGNNAKAGSPESSSAAKKENTSLTVKVYYPDDQGMKLIAVKRTIRTDTNDKYTAAMESLMEGTKEKGQTAIIPKQAKLKSVKVKGDTAYVDFTQALVKNFVGGSTGEEMLVGSVVDTLTEFPEIKKVQILVEGNKVESLSGHLDLTTPLSRMGNLIK